MTITAEHIPPEVVEAAARAACRTAYSNVPDYDWEQSMLEETDVYFWREQARAALAQEQTNDR